VAYKSTGRHLEDINCIMTLSDATLPTLPNIALKNFIKFGSGGLKSTFERRSTDKINTQISARIDPS